MYHPQKSQPGPSNTIHRLCFYSITADGLSYIFMHWIIDISNQSAVQISQFVEKNSHSLDFSVIMHQSIPSTNIPPPPGRPSGFCTPLLPRGRDSYLWPSPEAGFLHIHKITLVQWKSILSLNWHIVYLFITPLQVLAIQRKKEKEKKREQ